MKVIKRDGTEVQFDINKIINAISKANQSVSEIDRMEESDILHIAESIQKRCEVDGYAYSVEQIQDLVERGIIAKGFYRIAQNYIKYRYDRQLARKGNSIDQQILSLINYTNEDVKQENSNKNPAVASVQRDYMAGEVSKDLTKRFFLPKDIWKAHDEGIIHFHDADYFAQHIFNCFHPSEKFITNMGTKAFSEMEDGQSVRVRDCLGVWRDATVHKFGKQQMQKVFFSDGRSSKNVICTENHRWLLNDGKFTTDLQIGDKLWEADDNSTDNWVVVDIEKNYDNGMYYDAWCVVEPATHTFTLESGMVTGNCCLINLEDMLQNGTVISGTMIEKPHTLYTACNITTQIIAQVASCQYGGQSFSLTHLAPFVDMSRQKYRKEVYQELIEAGTHPEEMIVNSIAEQRLKKEIKQAMQLIQYQIITLMTTNGQAPFVTVFMYINEAPEGLLRDDLVLLIEEMLKQRYQGVKNSQGVYITPAFPKIIYVLQENNITEDSTYWRITQLAAKCTAKRMVPDYISEKIMKQLKGGDVYVAMG